MKNKPLALITGTTSGIDAEYARRLATNVHNLIITGRRETKFKAHSDGLCNSNGSDGEVIPAELSDSAQVNKLIENIKERGAHLLVNNAGFGTIIFSHPELFGLHEEMVAAYNLAFVLGVGLGLRLDLSIFSRFIPLWIETT